jgi:hypothetical protein
MLFWLSYRVPIEAKSAEEALHLKCKPVWLTLDSSSALELWSVVSIEDKDNGDWSL